MRSTTVAIAASIIELRGKGVWPISPAVASASPHAISSDESTPKSTVDRIFRPTYKKLTRVNVSRSQTRKNLRRTGRSQSRTRR